MHDITEIQNRADNSAIHNRRALRLKGYDYSRPGAYFVTICAHKCECLFGKIVDGKMVLNEYGKIVEQCWFDLPNHYGNVELNEFVIMPDHFHGIITITSGMSNVGTDYVSGTDDGVGTDVVGAGLKPAPTKKHEPAPTKKHKPGPSTTTKPAPVLDVPNIPETGKHHGLSEIVRALKTFSARRINQIRKTPGVRVWQRGFYDHIIRDGRSYQTIAEYITDNPLN